MFASQQLEVEEPLLDLLPSYDRRAFTPLGWAPDASRPVLEPFLPAGAVSVDERLRAVAGADAVFFVVPLLGALTVWATFVLGRGMAGHRAGRSRDLPQPFR